jgi:cytochrome b6-f complex iron-sulfur subunit
MADKKKMSVAEILAAARKADSSKDAGAAEGAASKPEAAPVPPTPAEAAEASSQAPATSQPATAKPAAKPAGGARPSVAEMLAAARAQKKNGDSATEAPQALAPKKDGAPKPAAAGAAKASPKAQPAAPEQSGPKDTGSILAAARNPSKPGPMSKAEAALRAPAEKVAPKPAKPRIPVPPMPAKPEYARPKAPPEETSEERRSFLMGVLLGSFFGLGNVAMATTFGLWTLGTARFMFPNVLTEPPNKFKVGFPSSFTPGQVETKFVPQYGVWVVNWEYNGKPEIYALRTVCTHLGCTPNWLEGEQKFKCPCHGSGFYKDGINFEGPAPRPLERYAIRIADDGQLEIDKSKIFQEEIGQWNDPASYVAV